MSASLRNVCYTLSRTQVAIAARQPQNIYRINNYHRLFPSPSLSANNRGFSTISTLAELMNTINAYSPGLNTIGGFLVGSTAFGTWIAGRFNPRTVSEKDGECEEIRQKLSSFQESANRTGLIQVINRHERTGVQQAKMYQEAKNRVMIIGTSANRVLLDKLDGEPNPIKERLIQFVTKEGGEVLLMIYDPNCKELSLEEDEIERINTTLKAAQNMPSFGDMFQVRLLSRIPHFHGDLIDNAKAHINPVSERALNGRIPQFVETYERGNQVNKFDRIKLEFEHLWKNAKPYQEARPPTPF